MATLGVSAVVASYAVSERIWHASIENSAEKPRVMSRVEKFYAAKANAALRPAPGPYRPVVALVRPDIHPAVLAAAMDRTESATHSDQTAVADVSKETRTLDVSSWRAPETQVAGLACSADGCRDSDRAPIADAVKLEVASLDVESTTIDVATIDTATVIDENETFETEPLVMPKPYKLGKNRASARQKLSRKVLTQYGDETGIVKFFGGQGNTGLRVAETPGDIIRRTLRGTI